MGRQPWLACRAYSEPCPPLRRLAAAGDTTKCPRAALYIIPALPNVRDAATFKLVRATYIDTVKRLAPAGALACASGGVCPLVPPGAMAARGDAGLFPPGLSQQPACGDHLQEPATHVRSVNGLVMLTQHPCRSISNVNTRC